MSVPEKCFYRFPKLPSLHFACWPVTWLRNKADTVSQDTLKTGKKNATVPWAQERVSELAIEWAQRSAWAKRTVRNMQTSERMSEWPTTFVLISWVSESQAIRCACHAFFDAPSHLYKRVCPSVRPSGRRSITPSLRRLLGTSYAQYSALLTSGFRFLADDEHAEEWFAQ